MGYRRNVSLSRLLDQAVAKTLLVGAAVMLHACHKPAVASFSKSDNASDQDFALEHQDSEGNNFISYRFSTTAITAGNFAGARKLSFTSSTIDMNSGMLTFEDFYLLSSDYFIKGLIHRAGTSSFNDDDSSKDSADDDSWYLDRSVKGQDPSLVALKSTVSTANLPAALKRLRQMAQDLKDPRLDETMKQIDNLVIDSPRTKVQTLKANDDSLITMLQVPHVDMRSFINSFPGQDQKISYRITIPTYVVMKRIYDVDVFLSSADHLTLRVKETLGTKVKNRSYQIWRHPNGQLTLTVYKYTSITTRDSWCLNDIIEDADGVKSVRFWAHSPESQKRLNVQVIPKVKLLLQNLPKALGEPLLPFFDEYLIAVSTNNLNPKPVTLKELSQEEDTAAADAAVDPEADSPDTSDRGSGATDPAADARATAAAESARGR